jgi:phage-related protein
MIRVSKTIVKPTEWVGSSKDDLRDFPEDVRRVMGVAIYDAQNGDEHPAVKALKGFGGRSILEVVDDYDGDTYRAVYTVKFAGVIYILHCFQKKSKKGGETPKHDMDVVKLRLKAAELHYNAHHVKGAKP